MYKLLSNLPALLTQTQIDIGEKAEEIKLPNATGYSEDARANVISAFGAFGVLISRFMNIALTVSVIALLIYLLWGAIEWLNSGGDKGKVEKARDKITQAIIGLVIMVSTVGIMLFVQSLLNICVIDFSGNGCMGSAAAGGGGGGASRCQYLCLSASACASGANSGTIMPGDCSQDGGGVCCRAQRY